jgi:hypothetical protein
VEPAGPPPLPDLIPQILLGPLGEQLEAFEATLAAGRGDAQQDLDALARLSRPAWLQANKVSLVAVSVPVHKNNTSINNSSKQCNLLGWFTRLVLLV